MACFCGSAHKAGGNWIYLWVKSEKPTYICDDSVTDDFGSDPNRFKNGFTGVDKDANRGAGGPYIFIWYRQTTDP